MRTEMDEIKSSLFFFKTMCVVSLSLLAFMAYQYSVVVAKADTMRPITQTEEWAKSVVDNLGKTA